MKHAKKLFSLALALIMALALAVPAMAASITIDNTNPGETYTAYKLFDVTTATDEEGAVVSYSYYTENDALVAILEEIGLTFDTSADGETYYVKTEKQLDDTWVFTTGDGTMTAAELAKKLSSKTTELDTAGVTKKSATVPEEANSVTIDGVDAGYYFVTSTLGTLCFLNTSADAVTIVEKNEEPTVDKKIEEDLSENTVEVGDILPFTITITAQPGADSYILTDTMSAGLTMRGEPVVKAGEVLLTDGNQYTYAPTDNGFTITFAQNYLDTITEETTITVTYSAMVNEEAVVGTDPITNEAVLDYGDESSTTSTTKTYVYDFNVSKIDAATREALAGAEFELYAQETGGTPIALVEVSDGVYRIATDAEIAVEGDANNTTTTIQMTSEGKATIKGLAGKDYWLEETKAPGGYNMLDARQKVTFAGDELATSDFGDVTVENNKGTQLPSTGGMGTTIFYVVGGVLMAGAAVLLVTKKKMSR